jgi:hypothetical protein
MSDVIHRKAAFGHSLCGRKVQTQETTLNDSLVNCPDCLRILGSISSSDTKTSILRRYVRKREKK